MIIVKIGAKIMSKKEKLHHIHCGIGDVGEYVLLPGDPGRTDLIAKRLDDAQLVAFNREHKTWTGYLNGVKVSVTSTGMGGPSAAIAVEELIKCGAHTFIRVGTAGRVAKKAKDKAVEGVICTAAVRDEGLTKEYVPVEYPAVANRVVLNALIDARDSFGHNFLEGITHCKDSYYSQVEPQNIPIENQLKKRWEVLERSNVLCAEMESASIFVLSSIRNTRAGSIMSFGNIELALDVAIEAIKRLIELDKK